MKNLTISALTLLLSTTCFFAQEKSKLKDVHQETITTTIVTKGVNEETTITETVKKETQVIKIKDTGVEDQNEVYSTEKSSTVNKTKEAVKINVENETAIEEIKKEQQKEIKDSKKAQLLKYEAERKAIEETRLEKFRKKDSLSGN